MKTVNKNGIAKPSNFALYLKGAKDSLPIVMGYIPVAIAFAVVALQTGFTPLQTICISLSSYSGAGQFLGVAMAGAGAGLITVAIGLFLINFRYFIMSTCVFARFKQLSTLKRLLFSHWVTDETFAIFTTAKEDLISVWYFAGLFLVSWCSWISGAVLGVVANDIFPYDLTQAMGIALYALFIAIVVPAGKSNFKLLIVILSAAILNILLSQVLDSCWAILSTIIICSAIGAFFVDAKVKSEDSKKTETVAQDSVSNNAEATQKEDEVVKNG